MTRGLRPERRAEKSPSVRVGNGSLGARSNATIGEDSRSCPQMPTGVKAPAEGAMPLSLFVVGVVWVMAPPERCCGQVAVGCLRTQPLRIYSEIFIMLPLALPAGS
jgi:hypothetical protein